MARLVIPTLLLLSLSVTFAPVVAGRWGVTVSQLDGTSESDFESNVQGLKWVEGGRTVEDSSIHSDNLPHAKPALRTSALQVAERAVRGILDMRYLDHINHQYHMSHEAHIRHQAHLAHLAHVAEHDATASAHTQVAQTALPVAQSNEVYGECSSPTSRCGFYFKGYQNSVPVLDLGSGMDHAISTAVMDASNELSIEVDSTGVGEFQCTNITSYNIIGNQFYITGTPGLLTARNFNEVRIHTRIICCDVYLCLDIIGL